jgi:hypothetical protein
MEGQYISTHMAAGWSRPREPRTYRSQATPTQVALAPTPTLPGYFERIGYDNRVQQYFKNRLHSMEKNRNPARKRARARACVCICVHCTYRVQIGHRSTKYNRTWHELGTNLASCNRCQNPQHRSMLQPPAPPPPPPPPHQPTFNHCFGAPPHPPLPAPPPKL